MVHAENPQGTTRSKKCLCGSSKEVLLADGASKRNIKGRPLQKLAAWALDATRMNEGIGEPHSPDAVGEKPRFLLRRLHQIEPNLRTQNPQRNGGETPAGSDVEDSDGLISRKNSKTGEARQDLKLNDAVNGGSGDEIDGLVLRAKELEEFAQLLFPFLSGAAFSLHEKPELAPGL